MYWMVSYTKDNNRWHLRYYYGTKKQVIKYCERRLKYIDIYIDEIDEEQAEIDEKVLGIKFLKV